MTTLLALPPSMMHNGVTDFMPLQSSPMTVASAPPPDITCWTSLPPMMTMSISPPYASTNRITTTQACKGGTWMCTIQANLNIIHHAYQLGTPCDHPATVYCDNSSGCHCQIIASQVATFLCHVGHKVFCIPTNYHNLCAWSCHNICITAANLLHHAHFSDFNIKNWLCWNSNTFLMSLQNTFYTDSQYTALITLGPNPSCH